MKYLGFTAALLRPPLALAQQIFDNHEQRKKEISELRQELARIAMRLDALEKQEQEEGAEEVSRVSATKVQPSSTSSSSSQIERNQQETFALKPEDVANLDFLRGTTINFGVDGYYGYNFNQPIRHVNLLCVYDVTSNSFSINQAGLVVEHLPTHEEGNRFGGRLVHDYSNKKFFLTDTPGVLSQSQSTATLGLMYWWGTKRGSW